MPVSFLFNASKPYSLIVVYCRPTRPLHRANIAGLKKSKTFKTKKIISMEILQKNTGEVKLWHVLVAVAVVAVGAILLTNAFTYQNIVVSGNNGSFLVESYFSPLTAEKKAAIGAAVDKAATETKKA